MARHTTQKEFIFGSLIESRLLNPDAGTSLTLEVWNGAGWTVDDLSPVTAPQEIFTRNTRIRVTPDTGGYYVGEEQSI